jgi:DNA-binding CsgD family transcriptional regulator
MYRAFQTFVDRLTESSDLLSLEESMAEVSAALHLSHFAYLALPAEHADAPVLISNYPAPWTAYYMRRRYERLDPVIVQAVRDTQPFRWGLGAAPRTQSETERDLFEQAAKFGIRCGFTVPIHDSKGAVAAVSFATDDLNIPFERSTNDHAQVLQLLAMYFHAHVRRMLSLDSAAGVSLSPRELECLEWSSRGKSAWEIGTIIGISRRTASFHLDNARAKLGVGTIRQAVVRLAEARSRS